MGIRSFYLQGEARSSDTSGIEVFRRELLEMMGRRGLQREPDNTLIKLACGGS